ncbi:hypothetical protein [Armatimonas sp.]|uniref:hypothetical protein n=1 Tax=Armatimonas sp. TaxID=1872638 RepID=UPI00286AF61F|nr:hypothetical protein [Armatimonas sp.]
MEELFDWGLRHLRASRYSHAARRSSFTLFEQERLLPAGREGSRTSALDGHEAHCEILQRSLPPSRDALRSPLPCYAAHILEPEQLPRSTQGSRTGATTETRRISMSRYVRHHLRASRYGCASPGYPEAFVAATVPPQAGSHRRREAVENVLRFLPFRPPGETCNQPFSHMLSPGQGICAPAGWVRRGGRHGARVQLGQLRSPPPSQGRGVVSIAVFIINYRAIKRMLKWQK